MKSRKVKSRKVKSPTLNLTPSHSLLRQRRLTFNLHTFQLLTFPQFLNHQSARTNTNKMLITAERVGSGAPECQRREIKSPRKLACRGFYFSRPIRKANTCLSAIRAHLGNLTRSLPLRLALRVNLRLIYRAPAQMLGCG